MEQKTSGLFDKAEAGNRTVAGRVSGSGFKVGKMEPLTPAPGELLEGLFQDDMPMELTEADYLDSFLDLSNFLPGDAEEKGPDDGLVETFEREMIGKVDFSGILSSLKEEASVFTTASAEVVSSTPDQPRKRKLAESDLIVEPFLDNDIVVDMMDGEQSPGSLTSDHDYVIKKPKLQSTLTEIESPFSVPVSSTSESQTTSKSKYRERRDKNNVASQRSRRIRKEKYIQMEQEADQLEIKNNKMREKITELEKLAKFMKAELIKKMTTAKA